MLRITVHSLVRHDAVGNFVLSIADKTAAAGVAYRLYAEHADPDVASVMPYVQLYEDMTAEDTLLYHFTFGDPAIPKIMGLPGRKIVYYHNMTPGHFFRPNFPLIADDLDVGRQMLPFIQNADGVFANSAWSLTDISAFIHDGAVSGAMPPFTPALLERFAHSQKGPTPLGSPYLLTVGRLAPHKNLEHALRLFAEVKRHHPDLMYVLLGNGSEEYKSSLVTYADRLDLGASVVFTGVQNDHEAAAWFGHARGLVCTSLHEGFCMPLVEAMALDVPAFATKQPAVVETLAGSGLLLDGDDIQVSADQLGDALDDSTFLETLVRAGRQRLGVLIAATENNRFWEELFALEKHQHMPLASAMAAPRRHIILTWRYLDIKGGITTFTLDLAEALAAAGHTVRILAQTQDLRKSKLVNGVMLEWLPVTAHPLTPEAAKRHIPQEIWNWSATVLQACNEINTELPIDIVESPIWDCEGIACLLHGPWPVVTSLHTTLHTVLETHPKWSLNEDWMENQIRPLLALENEILLTSDAVRANSHAIIKKIESTQGIVFNPNKTIVIHHGVRDVGRVAPPQTSDMLTVLFVGRLEARKGIDLLLEVIPALAGQYPNVRFVLIGDNAIPCETISDEAGNTTYMAAFKQHHAQESWFSQVEFAGKLSDEEVLSAYATCDIFCSPSRFESFGLIFLEAMRAGKPVIGCDAGGMPEIIIHGENGLLALPSDAQSLGEALQWMIEHAAERRTMGMKGRLRYLAHFTAATMAHKSNALYELAKRQKNAYNENSLY